MDHKRREFAGISIAGLLLYFSYALARSPVIPLFARSLGASPPLVGWIVAASTITGIVVKLPAGSLSDHFGRRTLLLVGACFFAFTPFFYATASSIGLLLLLRIVHGNATALFGPAASAAISDITAPSHRGIRLGLYASMQGVGQALGPFLGGVLISRVGFQAPFFLSGLVGCAGLACVFLSIRGHTPQAINSSRAKILQGLREVFGNRAILATSVTVAAMMVVVGSYNGFFPLYAMEVLGVDAWHIGAVFGVQTTTTLLARPLMGRFSDRVGRKPLILAALIWTAALIALLPHLPTSVGLLLAFGGAWGLGLSVVSSVAGALITDLSKRAHYGAAHGAFGAIYDIGEASGPILAGLVVAHLGYNVMFTAMGALLFLSSYLFLRTRIYTTTEQAP
jgi:DHA1 family multidrug resistance protein-like MFS transporter